MVTVVRIYRIVAASLRTLVRDRGNAKPRDWVIGAIVAMLGYGVVADLASSGAQQEQPRGLLGTDIATAIATDVPPTGAPDTATPTRTPNPTSTTAPKQFHTATPRATEAPPDTPEPTAVPATAAPQFAYDPPPCDTVNCADFTSRGTDPQAWWNARKSAECPNPGHLDGDSDGSVCEDGEGGVPAAAPPPVQPLMQAPPAARSSGAPQGSDCPADLPVKGNINRDGEKIYHTPGSGSYSRTIPEECFATAADAEAAGFRAPRN